VHRGQGQTVPLLVGQMASISYTKEAVTFIEKYFPSKILEIPIKQNSGAPYAGMKQNFGNVFFSLIQIFDNSFQEESTPEWCGKQSFCFSGSPLCKRAHDTTPFYLLSGQKLREFQVKQITIVLRKPPRAAL
jgi:hypothetical protein